MENKEKKLMSLVLDLEEKLIKLEELKSMMLALEEAIFMLKTGV